MQSQRQLNIELMRIFSMLLICLWHVNGHFLPLLPSAGSQVNKLLGLLMPYITFHVDLFVLITGYFGVHHLKKNVLKTSLLVFYYALVLGVLATYLGGAKLFLGTTFAILWFTMVVHAGLSSPVVMFSCLEEFLK